MTYKVYIKSDKWKKKRQAALERSKENANFDAEFGCCERCGYAPKRNGILQVHHKTYERLFDELLEDLEVLCPKCHKKETDKQDKEIFKIREEKMNMNKRVFTCEIKENIGTLAKKNSSTGIELNVVSWNGAKPVYDLRKWYVSLTGIRKAQHGFTISPEELKELKELLNSIDLEKAV